MKDTNMILVNADDFPMTDEFRKTALQWHDRIVTGTMNVMIGLKQFYDNQYYRALGYTSFEEYAEDATSYGSRQAYNYLKLIKTYSLEQLTEKLDEFGMRKLTAMTNLPEETRRLLLGGESAHIGDRVFTEGELKNMTAKEVERTVRESKREIARLRKENKELEQSYKKELEALESKYDAALEDADDALRRRLQGKIDELKARIEQFHAIPPNYSAQLIKANKHVAEGLSDLTRLVRFVKESDQAAGEFRGYLDNIKNAVNALYEKYADTTLNNI